MNKEFIPYELALELKQLGFDEPSLAFYERNKELVIQECEITDFHRDSLQCLAPLYQQAFRWLYRKLEINGVMTLDEEAQIALLKELIDKMSSKHLLV